MGIWSNAQTEIYVQAGFPCQVYLYTTATFYHKPVCVQPEESHKLLCLNPLTLLQHKCQIKLHILNATTVVSYKRLGGKNYLQSSVCVREQISFGSSKKGGLLSGRLFKDSEKGHLFQVQFLWLMLYLSERESDDCSSTGIQTGIALRF